MARATSKTDITTKITGSPTSTNSMMVVPARLSFLTILTSNPHLHGSGDGELSAHNAGNWNQLRGGVSHHDLHSRGCIGAIRATHRCGRYSHGTRSSAGG